MDDKPKFHVHDAMRQLGALLRSWDEQGFGIESATAVLVIITAKVAKRCGHAFVIKSDLRKVLATGENDMIRDALQDYGPRVVLP